MYDFCKLITGAHKLVCVTDDNEVSKILNSKQIHTEEGFQGYI